MSPARAYDVSRDGVERVNVHVQPTDRGRFTVQATSPDGQVAKVLVDLAAQNTDPGRSIAPDACEFEHRLKLRVTEANRERVVVSSNYDLSRRGCEGLKWHVAPESPSEPFAGKYDGLFVFPDRSGRAEFGITVTAYGPNGEVARLFVEPETY